MNTPIVRAQVRDAHQVAALIATAFQPLDPTAWLVPVEEDRHEVMAANVRILVEHAAEHGQVWTTGDGTAAAVWFPRDRPLAPPSRYDERLEEATGRWVDRFRHLDTLFDNHHPTDPHHHLAFLAVRPDRQGAGLGTALLQHTHARLDQAGMPAYLEAASPQARDLYTRHGYRPMPPFFLPDNTPFYPMWRPPARLRPAGTPQTATEPQSAGPGTQHGVAGMEQ